VRINVAPDSASVEFVRTAVAGGEQGGGQGGGGRRGGGGAKEPNGTIIDRYELSPRAVAPSKKESK
jgi:hypothetical protein